MTGSHIPTAEEVGPNPVLEISRDEIQKSGERTTAERLRRLPIEGFAGVPPANMVFGDTAGASSIALRGFDASNTLVLLNGRRLAPFPVGAAPTGRVMFVDLNSSPKDAVGSIEVLKDSASTVYGADVGVVNIKLRGDFQGVQIATHTATRSIPIRVKKQLLRIFGVGDDSGNITGVLDPFWTHCGAIPVSAAVGTVASAISTIVAGPTAHRLRSKFRLQAQLSTCGCNVVPFLTT